jgi:Na+/H+-dicarboxylate symporter
VNEYIVNGLFKAVGTLFVNALKMLVVPLVLFSLICGVCGIGNLNTLGRVGAKSFVLYLLTTAIAVATAVIFGVTAGIGQGMQASTASTFTGKEAPPLLDVFTNYQQDA